MRACKQLAVIFVVLAAAEAAYACSCAAPRPPCVYYGSTSAIFLGRVVGSSKQETYDDQHGNKIVVETGTVRFLIQENYKGAPGYEMKVHSGGPCGSSFLKNESYVVYAWRSTEDNEFYTGMCTRTRHISNAKEDLEYLRGLADARPGATLHGKLTRVIGDTYHGPFKEGPKMPGVKITITGEGQTVEARTNDAGEFKVTGLSPGNYDAVPELPDNLGSVSSNDERDNFGRFTGRKPIVLSERGCGEASFTVQFSGVVSGKVLQADGEPAKEVQVNLVSGEDAEKDWWTWTDKEGRYEFRNVQPGGYLLGFNLRWAPDKDDPYPKTFYPGVKTRSEASLITMGEGEKLKGYDMTLPPRLTERELKVTVVWPDGRPAVGVGVGYETSEFTSPGDRQETDAQGTVVIRLFDNYRYIVYSTAEINEKDFHSKPVELLVDKNLKPLRLVLDKEGYGYEERDALTRKRRGSSP